MTTTTIAPTTIGRTTYTVKVHPIVQENIQDRDRLRAIAEVKALGPIALTLPVDTGRPKPPSAQIAEYLAYWGRVTLPGGANPEACVDLARGTGWLNVYGRLAATLTITQDGAA